MIYSAHIAGEYLFFHRSEGLRSQKTIEKVADGYCLRYPDMKTNLMFL